MQERPKGTGETEIEAFGYTSQLKRTMGSLTSFALAFSMITITTTIFSSFKYGITTSGVLSLWVWPIVTVGVVLIAMVYGELSTRMPITGFSYQWMSRLTSAHYGWFTGWSAMMATICGVVVIADSFATYMTPALGLTNNQTDFAIVAGIAIILAIVLNVVGIKIATLINNIGAFVELFGTLLLGLIILMVALVHHNHPGSFLFSTAGMSGTHHANFVTFSMAALLPIWTLMGWEGSADLAEETVNARRVIPRAMLQSVVVCGIGSFVVVLAFTLATTNMNAMLNSPVPIVYLSKAIFGSWISPVIYAIALIAMFSALLANVAVCTRVMFSLSRDNMLPASRFLSRVHPKMQTPTNSVIVIGIVALIVNALGGAVLTLFAAIVSVAYYLIYFFTIAGSLYARGKGKMPNVDKGYFSLGKWFTPIAIIALIYIIAAVVMLTAPAGSHINGYSVLGGLVIGGLWYVFRLRKQIIERKAGPPNTHYTVDAVDGETLQF